MEKLYYTRLAGATVNKREGVATGARGEFNGQHSGAARILIVYAQ